MAFQGRLEVIKGPMFSGKSTEILRRLTIEAEMGLRVLYINHTTDDRSKDSFSTHNPLYKSSDCIDGKIKFSFTNSLEYIIECGKINEYDVIGIDEANFFGDNLFSPVIKMIEEYNKHVIVSGLPLDFERKMFGQISQLGDLADEVVTLKSCCKMCITQTPPLRSDALFTHRISKENTSQIETGGKDKYMPVCRKCYLELNKK